MRLLSVSFMAPVIFFLSLMILSSCFYDVEEEIYGDPCGILPATYSGAVLAILQPNCLGCHSNATREGNVTLEGYDEVIPYVENGSLLGSIQHDAGFSAMPQNTSKLRECDIDKIRVWINEGALNN